MKAFDRVEAYRVDGRLFATYEDMVNDQAERKLLETCASGDFVSERAYPILNRILKEPRKLYHILREFYG